MATVAVKAAPKGTPTSNGYKTFDVGFTAAGMPDLTGKVYLVTGANTGIGYETALALVQKGAKVYLACRSEQRATDAIAKINSATGTAASEKAIFLHLDLQDLKQVKQAADAFLTQETRLDALINNAGIMACPFALTKDGIESQFATNHVGHFLLTTTLLPLLLSTQSARIVNVSSYYHQLATSISFDTFQDPKACDTWQRYGESKLANILFTRSLVRKYPSLFSNVVHPGVVATELVRGPRRTYGILSAPMLALFSRFSCIPAPKGALAQLYCATSPDILSGGVKGVYFYPCGKASPQDLSSAAQNDELAEKLWSYTEVLISSALSK